MYTLGTIKDPGLLAEFANEFGCYSQFDLFGTENSYHQFKPSLDFPNDSDRISLIQSLIQEKFEDKILVSHDIHTKHRLVNQPIAINKDLLLNYYILV